MAYLSLIPGTLNIARNDPWVYSGVSTTKYHWVYSKTNKQTKRGFWWPARSNIFWDILPSLSSCWLTEIHPHPSWFSVVLFPLSLYQLTFPNSTPSNPVVMLTLSVRSHFTCMKNNWPHVCFVTWQSMREVATNQLFLFNTKCNEIPLLHTLQPTFLNELVGKYWYSKWSGLLLPLYLLHVNFLDFQRAKSHKEYINPIPCRTLSL